MWIYSRIAAAQYAEAHAIDHNSDWLRYENDCTDLISQALYAGGWDMVKGEEDEAWYGPDATNGRFTQSRSWAVAEDFARFMSLSGRAHKCARDELGLGDVVQLLDQGGRAVHSMIVSQVVNGQCNLSYHTEDRFNYPIWAVAAKTSDTLAYWKLHDAIESRDSFSRENVFGF